MGDCFTVSVGHGGGQQGAEAAQRATTRRFTMAVSKGTGRKSRKTSTYRWIMQIARRPGWARCLAEGRTCRSGSDDGQAQARSSRPAGSSKAQYWLRIERPFLWASPGGFRARRRKISSECGQWCVEAWSDVGGGSQFLPANSKPLRRLVQTLPPRNESSALCGVATPLPLVSPASDVFVSVRRLHSAIPHGQALGVAPSSPWTSHTHVTCQAIDLFATCPKRVGHERTCQLSVRPETSLQHVGPRRRTNDNLNLVVLLHRRKKRAAIPLVHTA